VRGAAVVVLVLVTAAVLAGGCGDAGSSKAPVGAAPATPATDARAEAIALAGRGDYAAAEQKYREALQQQPDDFDLHYGLASVLSQLDKRGEALEEFRWVVANGRPGRAEVDLARRWLAEAEAVPPTIPSAASTRAAQPPPIKGERGATGTITGKVVWPGLPTGKEYAIRIFVESEGVRGRKIVRSTLNGSYSVDELPAGSYKLMAAAGTVQMWKNLSVTVTAGQDTVLDLNPSNAAISPAEFGGR
jgi:tetratricopeptide (TPR) repeat protein